MKRKLPPVVVVLSGLDPTGGAGLLADIRALSSAGVRIAPLLTANTVQGAGIQADYHPTDERLLDRQLSAIHGLFQPSAVKIGMIGGSAVTAVIKKYLEATRLPTVLDPVLQASSGGMLSDSEFRDSILGLAQQVTVLTPNRIELEYLSGIPVNSRNQAIKAVENMTEAGFECIYVKGGHFEGDPCDILFRAGRIIREFQGRRMKYSTRGTGCHLASFMAGRLASGDSAEHACAAAYAYVQGMLCHYAEAGSGILPADLPLDAFNTDPYNYHHDE